MKTKMLVIFGAALGLWWVARKATANATAAIDAANARSVTTLNGVGEQVRLRRPIGSHLASRIGTVTNTQGLGGLMDAEDIGDADFRSLSPLNADGSEGFDSASLIEQTQQRDVNSAGLPLDQRVRRSTVPSNPARHRRDLRGGFGVSTERDFQSMDRIFQGDRDFQQLSLIEQTRMRHVGTPRTRAEQFFRSTVPSDPGRNATTSPWWAQHEILNRATPADPYHIQPLDRDGNVVNIGQETPDFQGRHGEVTVDTPAGEIYRVGTPIDPVEPGDPSYGAGTTTQYGDEDDQTYNPQPGDEIALMSDGS